MNATDLKRISTKVVDRERLDIVYNEILLPMLKNVAEKKGNELSIIDNCHRTEITFKLRELGFKTNLQYLCREEMKPYLIEKGFNISYSPYYTYIKF